MNLKCPFLVEDGEKVVDSPAKKIVVPKAGGIATQGVPIMPTKIPGRIRSTPQSNLWLKPRVGRLLVL